MQSVPNIVRQRLNAQRSEGNHPDANLLSAFAEKSLSDRERATVLDHLSCCAECRDILVFALPAAEEMQPAAKPSPSRWLTWPALRWGLVTAGVALIAAFGVMNYQRNSGSAQLSPPTSQNEPVKLAAKAEPAPINSEAPAEKTEKSSKKIAAAATTTVDKNLQPSPHQEHTMIASGLFNQSAPQSARTNAPVSLPSVSEPRQVQRQAAQMQAAPPAQSVQAEQADQSVTARSDDSDMRIGKAKAPVSVEVQVSGSAPAVSLEGANKAEKKNLPENGRSVSEMVAVTPSVAPRWNISSTGTLQRSFDQGATWEDVDVAASASTGAVIGGPLTAPSAEVSTMPMKMSKQSAPAALHAVAANGPDVWAGGSAGLLYHSTDSGNHWTRVLPSGGGAVLTGDIVSLDFPDAQHGKITTSAPEVWTTPDNGSTWEKQ